MAGEVDGVRVGSKPRGELGVERGPAEIVYLVRARLTGRPGALTRGN